jgi:hypothetical protein
MRLASQYGACCIEYIRLKLLGRAIVVEMFDREQEKFNEIQTDVTGYTFAKVIWRSRNEVRRTWWFLRCSRLKILM